MAYNRITLLRKKTIALNKSNSNDSEDKPGNTDCALE
jgi:hypothetical protein